MATARSQIVDLNVTRYYHCISRCVRGAFLCGKGYEHRKQWLEDRLEFLSEHFAISVAGFVAMDNHLHVLARIDPEVSRKWSDEEVLQRWLAIYSCGVNRKNKAHVRIWIESKLQNREIIEEYRKRLSSLSWFMKALKEPLARMANKEDGVPGAFWDGRFQSIAVLDDQAILATCIYVDLNPVSAGISKVPEESLHTSIRQRVLHFRRKGKLLSLQSAKGGSVIASEALGNAEQDHWLIPIEDRRPHTNAQPSSEREGMLETFTLGNYLSLVEYTGRMFREGKARIGDDIQDVFDRMETSQVLWWDRLKKMLLAKKLRGRCFAGSSQGIPRSVQQKSSTRLINLSPQMP